MNSTGKQKIHYAWVILVGCCILQGASLGMINNCAGVFYAPVCEELGFEMGRFTLYRMLFSLSSAATLPLAAKCLRKFDVRLVLGLAAVIYGGSTMSMGLFSHLYQWYVAGVIQGASSSFLCMIPAPIILGNWFHKRTGTAVGISAAFSGLMGMMGSSLLGFTIPALGWRASYLIVGAAAIVLILLAAVFVIRYRPEDKNMVAYEADGAAEEIAGQKDLAAAEKRTQKAAAEKDSGERPEKEVLGLGDFLRQPMFLIATLAFGLSIASSYFNMFLTPCGLAVGMPMAAATLMTTLALLGNMVSKLCLGKASDSFGAVLVLKASVILAVMGFGLLLLGRPAGMLAGSLLFGLVPPMSSVMMPLYCRLFWKGDTYAAAYSYISMFGTIMSAPFNMLFGQFYDWTGTYSLSIGVGAALIVLVYFLVSVGKSPKNS